MISIKAPLSAKASGWVYAFVHFSVETACFSFLASRCSAGSDWWILAILYDALAFVPQEPIGMLADRFPKLKLASFGCAMLLCSLFLPWTVAALPLLAIGNAFVHVGGAEATLRGANGRLAPSGVFVAGGSFGVVTGQLLGKNGGTAAVAVPTALMLLSLLAVTLFRMEKSDRADGFAVDAPLPDALLVILAFVTVAARSYIGYAIPTSWNKTVPQTVLLFVCMGCGKALGGYCADAFGARRTAIASLLVALPFLACGDRMMVVSLIGVALFSMTMTVTLGVLVSRFSGAPGFAFGITTVGLFVGSAPAFFIRPETLAANIAVVVILTLVAIVCFAFCATDGKTHSGR